MANDNVNKVEFGGEVLIDLTEDTVTPKTLAKGVTAHDASGAKIVGEFVSEFVITAIASVGELTNISASFEEIYEAHLSGQTISLHVQSPSGSTTFLQCTNIDSDWAIFDAITTIAGEPLIQSAIIFSDDASTYTSASMGGGTEDAVQYIEQDLTDGQKSQARKNIDALGVHYGSDEPPSDDYVWVNPDEDPPATPTKLSQLENDSGFLTQQSLAGYAKTANHYSKTESDNKYQPKGNYLTSHQDISGKADKSSAETWTFTLEDGSTVTKKVVLA